MEEKPMSENIGTYEANKYIVTAAIWRTHLPDGSQTDAYEIGIREKSSGKFWLLQNDFDHQSVQEVANAIAHLLGMPEISGEHYTPEWCMRHFQ